jgi:2-oxoglutarate ferredoxin oxidoreductase subunit beta
VGEEALVVHDAHHDDPTLAFALARLAASPNDPTPIGVFRAVEGPVGISEAGRKLAQARANLVPGALDELLHGSDTWTVA